MHTIQGLVLTEVDLRSLCSKQLGSVILTIHGLLQLGQISHSGFRQLLVRYMIIISLDRFDLNSFVAIKLESMLNIRYLLMI